MTEKNQISQKEDNFIIRNEFLEQFYYRVLEDICQIPNTYIFGSSAIFAGNKVLCSDNFQHMVSCVKKSKNEEQEFFIRDIDIVTNLKSESALEHILEKYNYKDKSNKTNYNQVFGKNVMKLKKAEITFHTTDFEKRIIDRINEDLENDYNCDYDIAQKISLDIIVISRTNNDISMFDGNPYLPSNIYRNFCVRVDKNFLGMSVKYTNRDIVHNMSKITDLSKTMFLKDMISGVKDTIWRYNKKCTKSGDNINTEISENNMNRILKNKNNPFFVFKTCSENNMFPDVIKFPNLKTEKYTHDDNCVICCNSMLNDDCVKLSCNHYFHELCFANMFLILLQNIHITLKNRRNSLRTQYDIEGNIITKFVNQCPCCRTQFFPSKELNKEFVVCNKKPFKYYKLRNTKIFNDLFT